MQTKEKYFLYILLACCLVLTFFIFLPFLVPIVFGVCFAVLFHPLYVYFLEHFNGRRSLAALCTVVCFVLLVCIPLGFVGIIGYQETQALFSGDSNSVVPLIENIIKRVQASLPVSINIDFAEEATNLLRLASSNIGNVFKATFGTLLSLLLVILSLFFFLRDGRQWRAAVMQVSPFSDEHNLIILDGLERAVKGIMRGYLLIAAIQGTLMGLGLWVFGVPHVVLWGLAASIASLIPVVGTLAVSVPATIYLFATGNTLAGIGFMIWALVLVGGIDNILNPIIVGRKVNIHPLMILFSVLGGVSFFGPVGILLGPLVASLLYILIMMYRKEFIE